MNAGSEREITGAAFDYNRYKRLLAEAVDEPKRLALIDLLIKERAKDRLDAATIAKVLGGSADGHRLAAELRIVPLLDRA